MSDPPAEGGRSSDQLPPAEPLRLDEARYRALFEQAPDVLYVLDLAGRLTDVNGAAEALTGYTRAELLAMPVGELVPEEFHDRLREMLARKAGGAEQTTYELQVVAKDGRRIWAEVTSRLVEQDGAPVAVYGRLTEITARKRAEEALRAGERELRVLLENLPVGVWLTDASGTILVDNPAGQRIWGVRHAERDHMGRARGRRPDTGEPIAAGDWSLARALRTGEAVLDELIAIEAEDGARKTILSSAVPVRDESGAVVGAVVINEDQTERLRAQAALHVLAEAGAVLGASLDDGETLDAVARLAVPRLADWCAIYLVADDGAVEQRAIAASDPETEARVRALHERYPYDPAGPSGVPRVIRTGEPELIEDVTDEHLAGDAKDDEHLRLLRELGMCSYLRVPLMAHGRTLGALSLVSAASDRRFGPDDVTLARELAQRAAAAVEHAQLLREAREAAAAAEAAVAVRDQFLSIAAHELRTPLTAMKVGIQIVRRQLARGAPVDEVNALAARTERQVDRLAGLIDPLLDVSRIATGRLTIDREPVALVPLVRRVVELERAADEQPRDIELREPEAHPTVLGDEGRIEQVLINLLENARKYSERETPIDVAVTVEGDHAAVAVRDRGIGIPEAEQALVFERFHRASNVSRGVSGFGLGLHLAREIARMHGGDLTLDSRPGDGSVFTLTLPLAAEE